MVQALPSSSENLSTTDEASHPGAGHQAASREVAMRAKAEARKAVSAFLVDVGTFAAKVDRVILVFADSTWRTDRELWESVQKASNMIQI